MQGKVPPKTARVGYYTNKEASIDIPPGMLSKYDKESINSQFTGKFYIPGFLILYKFHPG